MASSSEPQTRALASTSVALTAETTSLHTGGCGVTTTRSLKPKFFIARAAAPMLFGSRGRTSTILLLGIFLRGHVEAEKQKDGATGRRGDILSSPRRPVAPSLPLSFPYSLCLFLSLRSRGQDVIFFACRVEGDAALLQVGVLAQMRCQRRTVSADYAGVGQRARLQAIEEVADVLLFERLVILTLDRRRWGGPAPGRRFLIDVAATVNVEPALGSHQFQRRPTRAGNQRGVKRGDPFARIFELDADRVRRCAPVRVSINASGGSRRHG